MGVSKNGVGCACSCTGCAVQFNITSPCTSTALPFAACNVWNSSSKTTLYGTGTTDATGRASFNLTVVSGSWYYEVVHPRFTTLTGTRSCSAGTTTVANLAFVTVATGYHCNTHCSLPLPDVLHYSDSFNGALTITWNAATSLWEGQTTTSFPGGTNPFAGTCTGVTEDVFVTMGVTGNLQVKYERITTNGCAGHGSVVGGGPTYVNNVSGTSIDCSTGVAVGTVSWSGRQLNPVSAASITGTFTE